MSVETKRERQAEADALWAELTGPREPKSLGRATLYGLIAAIVGGLSWALIATVTSRQFGFAAIALGFVVGVIVVRTAEAPSRKVAALASTLAVTGLLVAKLAIAIVAVPRIEAASLARDEEFLTELIFRTKVSNAEIDGVTAEAYERSRGGGRLPPELTERVERLEHDLRQEVREVVASEAEERLLPLVERRLSSRPFHERLPLSLYDLVWFPLTIGAAWQIASTGRVGSDD